MSSDREEMCVQNEKDICEQRGLSIKLSFTRDGLSITPAPIGTLTGSKHKDFYVYVWFIKDTLEVFYVGKGRGDRYKTFHERAYEAEKVRNSYETDTHFVQTDLTEEQALILESKVMAYILNETNDRLTNRIIPLGTKRGNGYGPSPTTPKLELEKTPCLYVCEIDEHFFGKECRAFDKVRGENLKAVFFITSNMRSEIEVIYAGNGEKYYSEVTDLLNANGCKVLRSQFAKSVTAWVYIGDDDVHNYEINQKKAKSRLGREIPVYHLLDVRNYLYANSEGISTVIDEPILVKPIHNRVPLENIRNLADWEKGFDAGYPYWERGEKERKRGNIESSIKMFDSARYNGYSTYSLYISYARAYRKLKDYDNEIAILDEAIKRLSDGSAKTTMEFAQRREKALLLKSRS